LQIEQYPPKRPNLLLVVVLAGGALLLILVLAYFFIDLEGSHLQIRHRDCDGECSLSSAQLRGEQISALSTLRKWTSDMKMWSGRKASLSERFCL